MSLYGWTILLLSVGGTSGFLIWCLIRVLRDSGRADRLHSTSDLDPRKSDR